MKKNHSRAIDTDKDFHLGVDISLREKEIVGEVETKTKFKPEKLIWKSNYWNTRQTGAFHYLGSYKKRKAVLKIQGARPLVSEAFMIAQFEKQNRSKIIRPPKLYQLVPWQDKSGYEALIMEYASGKPVMSGGRRQTKESIDTFCRYYLEYRNNCLPRKPWLDKPKKENYQAKLIKAFARAKKIFPHHQYRKKEDEKLVIRSAGLLEKLFWSCDQEFLHGHFSRYDLIRQGSQVVVFSNLFWRWGVPFYDATFAYHWSIFELEWVKGIDPKQVEEERQTWFSSLFNLPLFKGSGKNTRLLKGSFLLQAINGLIIDGFMMTTKNKISEYLFQANREEVKRLVEELSLS